MPSRSFLKSKGNQASEFDLSDTPRKGGGAWVSLPAPLTFGVAGTLKTRSPTLNDLQHLLLLYLDGLPRVPVDDACGTNLLTKKLSIRYLPPPALIHIKLCPGLVYLTIWSSKSLALNTGTWEMIIGYRGTRWTFSEILCCHVQASNSGSHCTLKLWRQTITDFGWQGVSDH